MSLYKYVVPDRWRDIFERGFVRFTQPGLFNDPFELKPYFEYFEEEEKLRSDYSKLLDEDFRSVLDAITKLEYEKQPAEVKARHSFDQFLQAIKPGLDIVQNVIGIGTEHAIAKMSNKGGPVTPDTKSEYLIFDKLIGVLSLTERRDSLLMWAHYAAEHQGLVIEFDQAHEFFNSDTQSVPHMKNLLGPAMLNIHSDERWDEIDKMAREMYSNHVEGAGEGEEEESKLGRLFKVIYSRKRPCRKSFNEVTPDDLLLTKSLDWRYEKEWRIFRLLGQADKVVNFEGGDIYLFSIPPECIKGVIFGCRINSVCKKEVVKFLNSSVGYRHVKKYQATVDEIEFKLNISEI